MTRKDVDASYVGSAVRTLAGDACVAGRAKYADDFSFPGQLHVHFVRSAYAAATIKGIDLDAARKVAGVVLAMEGREAAEYLDPIPHYIDPAVFGGKSAVVRCLALDRVWYYGQPVAVVVAEDKETARYAASRVTVEYEPTTPVVDTGEAMRADAPRVVAEWDDNVLMAVPFVDGNVDEAFRTADRVVKTSVRIHRFSAQPIETRVYNAAWDHGTHGITLYATAQNPHPLRHVLSKCLRMPENKIRIIAPVMGGGFGLKMHGHPEEALVCLLAQQTRRPVKWVENREECLLIGAREQVHEVELAVNADGKILGLRDHFVANVGAPSACPGWGMAFLTGLTMPGPYSVRDIDVSMSVVVTNKPPWNASRGYGKEATALALELAIDNAARQLGIDPVEMRCKNFVPPDAFPYNSPTGLVYDSGDYEGATRKVLDAIGYDHWRRQQVSAREEGRYLGVGVAYELTPEGGALPGTMVAGYDSSSVRVDPGGSVTVLTGVTNPGSGNPTGIAQIVADELGVDIDTVEVVQGDTKSCPYGFGNYSGRSMIVGGGSAALAAREVREKIVTIAAALLGVEADTISIDRGTVTSDAAASRSLGFGEVCYAAYTRAYDLGLAIEPPLEATRTFRPGLIRHVPDEAGRINPYPSYSNAAYATVCEVDVETGKVTVLRFAAAHDCGKVINPVLVEGQACGAIAFGIGGVLNEELRFDENGRQLTKGFTQYVMPRAADVPDISMVHHDTPNPETFMGLKG
ncbi:MAG: xanthine dehydrogenase family protein molybdopterin-binding subunit, partial [Gammaproteobacteria bacterium]|nr:xanthine dehydrogenase family protein molybdopterin-binding subunit [Gammaproteobacteria bacterium]